MNGEQKEDKSVLKQIRTFQGDVAEALKNQNESLVTIQRAEAVKAAEPKEGKQVFPTVDVEKKKRSFLLYGSIILVALCVAGGWYAYSRIDFGTTPLLPPDTENTLISSNEAIKIDATNLTRENLLANIVATYRNNPPTTNPLHIDLRYTGTDLVEISLPIEKFLEILETNPPGNLVRALEPTFMLGALGEKSTSIFMILRLSSFENAFAGMLGWEDTMVADIGPLFATRDNLARFENPQAFEDITTRNKDARVIRDQSGKVIFVYSFYDRNTLIITDSDDSLRSLISRLNTALLSR